MIISFKCEGKFSYGNLLLEILKYNLPDDLDEIDSVVPVPLHIDKLRQRKYNQSVMLADGLARYFGVTCVCLVLRK